MNHYANRTLIVSCTKDYKSRANDFQGSSSDVVDVSCFSVKVLVMFHFMFVHYTFSSVWVAEWPPFGK